MWTTCISCMFWKLNAVRTLAEKNRNITLSATKKKRVDWFLVRIDSCMFIIRKVWMRPISNNNLQFGSLKIGDKLTRVTWAKLASKKINDTFFKKTEILVILKIGVLRYVFLKFLRNCCVIDLHLGKVTFCWVTIISIRQLKILDFLHESGKCWLKIPRTSGFKPFATMKIPILQHFVSSHCSTWRPWTAVAFLMRTLCVFFPLFFQWRDIPLMDFLGNRVALIRLACPKKSSSFLCIFMLISSIDGILFASAQLFSIPSISPCSSPWRFLFITSFSLFILSVHKILFRN